jgi:hypothetical protein
MEVRSLRSDLSYFRQLVGAGWDGIASARQELNSGVFPSPRQAVLWTPAAIGATIGVLGPRLIGNRKSASSMAMGGLVGSVLGFGAALAWSSRRFTGPAARKAVRNVNAARDARWLETHPINYA